MNPWGCVCDFCDNPYKAVVWSPPFICDRCTRTRDFMLWNPSFVPRHWAVIPHETRS